MTYDDFAEKLRKLKAEFRKLEGREISTISELEKFLDRRLARPKKSGARSLKGLF